MNLVPLLLFRANLANIMIGKKLDFLYTFPVEHSCLGNEYISSGN